MTGPTPKTFTCVGCSLYSSTIFTGNEPIPQHQCRGGIKSGEVVLMDSSDTPVACPYLPWKGLQMNVIDKILATNGRYDNPIREFKASDFGRYVLTWLGPPRQYMVGKLVQVRLEAGEYGSDMVILRQYDNVLMRHENQNFYSIPESFLKELDKLFSCVDQDGVEIEYTVANGEQPEKGFIIPSKIPDGESTLMRDVVNACKYEIAKLIVSSEGKGKGE